MKRVIINIVGGQLFSDSQRANSTYRGGNKGLLWHHYWCSRYHHVVMQIE